MLIKTSLSYPDGLLSGIAYRSDHFDIAADVLYRENLSFSRFYFLSDRIAFGPLSYSGFSSGLLSGMGSFYDPGKREGAEINTEGNLESGLGIVFTPNISTGGFSFFRDECTSRSYIWLVPDILEAGSLVFGQSVTLPEDPGEDESWYYEEEPLFSPFFLHSLAGLNLESDSLSAGGRIIVNSSLRDRSGASLLFTGRAENAFALVQGEILWSSPYFVAADLEHSREAFLIRLRGEAKNRPYRLKTQLKFSAGRVTNANLFREIEFSHEISFGKEWSSNSIESSLELSLSGGPEGNYLPDISIDAEYGHHVHGVSWSGSVLASYEESVYRYRIKLGGEINRGRMVISADLAVEIDTEIALLGGAVFSFGTDSWSLSGKAGFEDLGLYNSALSDWNPCFSLEYKSKVLIGP
ncbi:MAG: hypothetical protein JXR86_20870 [Spirochaetales bacterium]|nr:hypothetical protein [Spirochaetales bacterium]